MDLVSVFERFPTQEDCIKHLESIRWQDGVVCPYCSSSKITSIKDGHRHHCNYCNTSFSVTVGTIFHNTKLPLQKWFLAISIILNAKKGVSARQLGRDLKVTKDTAWRVAMQIRKAMRDSGELLEGVIEADETYLGGKNKNRHSDKKTKGGQGRGGEDKDSIFGVAQREGKVRAKKVKNVKKSTLHKEIRRNVVRGSTIMTDEWLGYHGLSNDYIHQKINHSIGEYVNGKIHTNTIENFWSLFKRGFVGQYHQLSSKYLDRYLDEFCFRYNNRNMKDLFGLVISQGLGV